MEIEWIAVDEVIPYENNPRKNEASIDKVAASIKEFGFKQPIVIDKNGIIVVGHTRLEAAKQLGWEKVPCIRANDLTDEQAKAYRLADNKVGESSEWEFNLLGEELGSIFEIDMSEFGFEEITLGGVWYGLFITRWRKIRNLPNDLYLTRGTKRSNFKGIGCRRRTVGNFRQHKQKRQCTL